MDYFGVHVLWRGGYMVAPLVAPMESTTQIVGLRHLDPLVRQSQFNLMRLKVS